MYRISVIAMFKNESMIIKDWIEHYLREGVEHFYLIDNGSTDYYYEKIKMYEKYFTLTKESLIKLTHHLDKLELTYNTILKEYNSRTNK